jgi:hypothetical protein
VNNEAPELSPEARRIISEARGFDDPTAEDRARVKTRWLASVAALAGVSSLTEAARAAGGVGWGLKAVGAALGLFAGAIGLYVALPSEPAREQHAAAGAPAWAGEAHERFEKTSSGTRGEASSRGGEVSGVAVAKSQPAAPPVTSQPVTSQPVTLQPLSPQPVSSQPVSPQPVSGLAPALLQAPAANVESEAVAAEGVVPSEQPLMAGPRPRPVPVRAVPPRATRGASPKVAPPVEKAAEESAPSVIAVAQPAEPGPNGQLSDELALLSQIRGSVQAGASTRALELLASYESRFGHPIMGMEADALRVDALCGAGQRDAARASARAFQIEWPGSPLGPRVTAACP